MAEQSKLAAHGLGGQENARDELLKIECRGVRLWLINKFSAADVLQLPVAERLQLVPDIWDSIADAPEALELTSEDKKLIDERLAARLQNPGAGRLGGRFMPASLPGRSEPI